MLLLYIIFTVYILAINFYSVMLLISQKNQYTEDEKAFNSGDGKLILSALMGGAVGIYAAMSITRFKLKNMLFMILMPVISAINIWFIVLAYRSGFTFAAP